MDLKLSQKIALVSGSTAGIGLAIAAALAQEGAMVIVNGRTQERVKRAIDLQQRNCSQCQAARRGGRFGNCKRSRRIIRSSSRGRHSGKQSGNLRSESI